MPLLAWTQKVWFQRTGTQAALPPNDTPKLEANRIKHIQQIVGSILYYTWAVDMTVQYPVVKYIGLGGGHVHNWYGLHINQLFYPAMLRGIGVDMYIFW